MKLLIVYFSPAFCYFLSLRTKHLPLYPFLRHPQPVFFLRVRYQISHPLKRQTKLYFSKYCKGVKCSRLWFSRAVCYIRNILKFGFSVRHASVARVIGYCCTVRLRPEWQRPACTRFHARAGDWRFCVLRDSDRLVAQWRQ